MNDWDRMTDDELMAALGEAVAEGESVSTRRRDAARAAFAWRTIDEELAELLHDSALEAGAAVRSAVAEPRTLSFRKEAVTVEIEVDGDDVLGEIIGDPAAGDGSREPTVVKLQRPGAAERSAIADVSGFFRFEHVESGPARFVVVTRSGWSVTTPWTTL